MVRVDQLLDEALKLLPAKPADSATQSEKRRYSELVSQKLAVAIAQELRQRGLKDARPAGEGDLGDSGAERRMAGGLGAKKVDVTWATEESGLLLAISIKSINFRDSKTKNFQKNLINRRGDMLMEAVTLHRRFPYAVLGAFFFLDKEAENDDTKKRRSTLANAHSRLQLFTGRNDPAGREEQFERFYLILLDARPDIVILRPFAVGEGVTQLSFGEILDDLLKLVAQRNPDFYEFTEGNLQRAQ
jgi:hypothetical protein